MSLFNGPVERIDSARMVRARRGVIVDPLSLITEARLLS